jgi:hypothetical protein
MKIFVSYSSQDRTLIEGFVNDLESLQHTVWFDKKLTGGQEWWDSILSSIRECEAFVFALTQNSLDSYPCRLEYTYATQLGKPILPIMLKDITVSVLPTELSIIQMVDYRNADRKSAFDLSRSLSSLPAAKPLPDPLPTPPTVPVSPLTKISSLLDKPSLDLSEQAAIVTELERYLKDKDVADGARQLLIRFAKREDLQAEVEKRLDMLLGRKQARRGWAFVLVGIILLGAAVAVVALGSNNNRPQETIATATSEPMPFSSDIFAEVWDALPPAFDNFTKNVQSDPVTSADSIVWDFEYSDSTIPSGLLFQVSLFQTIEQADAALQSWAGTEERRLGIGDDSFVTIDLETASVDHAGIRSANMVIHVGRSNTFSPMDTAEAENILRTMLEAFQTVV